MNRPGWDASRRNRNVGTRKAGHGASNRLAIPRPHSDDRMFWARLRGAVPVGAGAFCVWVEPCRPGFVHAVTVPDVVRMLGLLPAEDVSGLRNVVLRQPTKKQRLLSQVWGRFIYSASFGGHEGPAIILEAHPLGESFHRRRSEQPDEVMETERLRADGHDVAGGRRWTVKTTIDSVRKTQLFRTVPHEVGITSTTSEPCSSPPRRTPTAGWASGNATSRSLIGSAKTSLIATLATRSNDSPREVTYLLTASPMDPP